MNNNNNNDRCMAEMHNKQSSYFLTSSLNLKIMKRIDVLFMVSNSSRWAYNRSSNFP